jgi:hypothetical protein
MAHTQAIDAAAPLGTDAASGGALEFRNLKRDIKERMELEHFWDDALTGDPQDGTHLNITQIGTGIVANKEMIKGTTYSLTSSNAQSVIDYTGTWNTSGTPTAIKLNLTDTASNSASLLMDLQIGGSSKFKVDKAGKLTTVGGMAITGDLKMTNAAGPALEDAAATTTNPTLIPNQAEMDTGIGWASDTLHFVLGGANEVQLTTAALTPGTSDGNALGTGSLMWSDLFLASAGVINFNNGDVTMTHASNELTIAGGDVTISEDLTVTGTGPHAIGGASVDYVQLLFPGDFTSGGAVSSASMIKVSGALVGHSGDSDGLLYFRVSPTSITINGNATTVATLYVDEPVLVEASGNATNSATVYIGGAATEATNNYALWVDAGASRLDGTLSVSSGSAGSPGIMMDEDTDTGFFRPGANRMAVSTAGVSRMEWAAGGLVGINETANGNMTVGLTINQGVADNQAVCLKSSDIATGLTTGTITQDMETDDWFSVSKRDGATGGVLFTVLREDGGAGTVWEVQAYGSTASTADNTGEEGPLHLFAAEHDGSNGLVNAPTDANLLTVQSWSGGAKTTRLLLKADDGELHLGNTTLVALDDEEDIQYVRAMQFETSHGTGMAKTPWDTTDYGIPPFSHQMLMDIGVLGEKDENGECLFRVQPRFAMNEGAIWQLYCHNRTLAERVETLERRLLDA